MAVATAKSGALGGAVAIGLVVTWVDSNIGQLFWIVLALGLLDVLITTADDLTRHTELAPGRMMKAAATLAIPVFIRAFFATTLTSGITGTSLHTSMQYAMAAVIAAQVAGLLPRLVELQRYLTKLVTPHNRAARVAIDALTADELVRLAKLLEARLADVSPSAADKVQGAVAADVPPEALANRRDGQ
jgi:hypothetical protein